MHAPLNRECPFEDACHATGLLASVIHHAVKHHVHRRSQHHNCTGFPSQTVGMWHTQRLSAAVSFSDTCGVMHDDVMMDGWHDVAAWTSLSVSKPHISELLLGHEVR
jgi:hypothetical protein